MGSGGGGYGAAAAQAGSTILSALSQQNAGQAYAAAGGQQQAADNYRAGILRTQAGQVQAFGSQQVANTALQTRTQLSNVRAAAAANGGSSTAPGVLNIEGQVGARGQYNSLSELYAANEQAAGLTDEANATEYGGEVAFDTGKYKQAVEDQQSTATALTGVASFANKYGGYFSSSGGSAGPTTNGMPNSMVAELDG